MGTDLHEIIFGLGNWGQRWIESRLSLKNLDPSLLMWDMRRRLDPDPMPPRRCTIHFLYPELRANDRNWWLVINEGTVDLCSFDPGFDVDLQISGSLRAMTAVWMGVARIEDEVSAGRLSVDGDRILRRSLGDWLGLSPFAKELRKVS